MHSAALVEALSWTEAKKVYDAGQRQFVCWPRYPMHPQPGERTCKQCMAGASIVAVDHRDNGALVIRCAYCKCRLKGGKYHIGLDHKEPKKDRQFDDWTRTAILKRDKCRCFQCGSGPEEDFLEVDHIIPHCMKGPTCLENGITLCRSCNQAKSGRFDTNFVIRALIYTHMTDEERIDGNPATVQSVFKRAYAFYIKWLEVARSA